MEARCSKSKEVYLESAEVKRFIRSNINDKYLFHKELL
jgi:hypothetical protein